MSPTSSRAQRPDYPEARRAGVVEKLHGTEVADPYRWMEDVDSEETRTWIAAQNGLAEEYFSETPGRDWIRRKLTELWDYEKYGLPREAGGRLFYTRKTGLQNQGVLYWKEDREGAEESVLLDPNLLSEDGTVALSAYRVSEDGRWLAYALSESGSDWREWRIRSVDDGEDLDEVLRWVKFSSVAWDRRGEGFYYSRYPEPEEGEELASVNENQSVHYHRLGSPQEEDRLVYERPDEPKWGYGAWVTEDGRYLTLSVWRGSGSENAFFYRELAPETEEGAEGTDEAPGGDGSGGAASEREGDFIELIPAFDHEFSLLGNDGPVFYFKTDLGAPNGRVVAIDTAAPGAGPEKLREILPESGQTLEDVSLLGDRLFATYLVDVHSEVRVFDLKGRHLHDVDLPGLGSAWGFGGRRDAGETFYYFTSYTEPGSVHRYDLATDKQEVFARPETAFPAGEYETRQVFCTSEDGTRVPLFLVHRKGLERDGAHPVRLYGYGGFNVSLTPAYSPTVATWLEMGGVAAVANLRGGGEYGEEWHEAGTMERKQNVFDDFLAAAEFLVDEGYTSPSKLAIAGGSNGGLLVGACLNQRPELFGAAIASVGVFDMLRFHKFTIGWAWTTEYGDPGSPEDFPALRAYSPLHNVQSEKSYPPLLLTTADHDDRVFPAHSFKFGAALQHAQTGEAPILLRIETKAGHGAGKPTAKAIEETVDEWSFLARELGMELPEE